ncbi:MAG: ABC transporter substrate binding protein, partial [Oscillospiraceae bacterium]|nr:ABC transporter substrate binding protein [Oscillospiraceae bacterium]
QLDMIEAFLPEVDEIGVLYTTSEPNSISQLASLEAAAAQRSISIKSIGVTNSSEVAAAAASIVAEGVDCLTNLTDNNVVDNLSTVLHVTNEVGIPVFGSEEEQVRNGCLGSMSIDYIEIGRISGQMAAQILLGEKTADELPVSTESGCTPVYNSAVAAALSIEIPAEYADAADLAA